MFMTTECVLLLFSPSAIVTTDDAPPIANCPDQASDTKEETINNLKIVQPIFRSSTTTFKMIRFVTLYHRVDSVAVELWPRASVGDS